MSTEKKCKYCLSPVFGQKRTCLGCKIRMNKVKCRRRYLRVKKGRLCTFEEKDIQLLMSFEVQGWWKFKGMIWL